MPYCGGIEPTCPFEVGISASLAKREIHVIAAEQQVISHRLANERQLALLFHGPDQAEIAGAAADVDHQSASAWLKRRLFSLGERVPRQQ